MHRWATEFRTFLMRGNLVELAVAFVIGVAFGALVKAFVDDLVTPIVAAIFGRQDFSNLYFTINDSRFLYGDFINAAITFLSVAAAVFFFVVKPVNAIAERRAKSPDEDDPARACPECLSEIPKAAKRCAFCTAEVGVMAV